MGATWKEWLLRSYPVGVVFFSKEHVNAFFSPFALHVLLHVEWDLIVDSNTRRAEGPHQSFPLCVVVFCAKARDPSMPSSRTHRSYQCPCFRPPSVKYRWTRLSLLIVALKLQSFRDGLSLLWLDTTAAPAAAAEASVCVVGDGSVPAVDGLPGNLVIATLCGPRRLSFFFRLFLVRLFASSLSRRFFLWSYFTKSSETTRPALSIQSRNPLPSWMSGSPNRPMIPGFETIRGPLIACS